MTLLTAYLSSTKVRRTLSVKPGQQGFSLIELVVVIAILAILAAVAIPNFINIQKEGQVNAAKTTLATIIKECAVTATRGNTAINSNIQADDATLNGYTLINTGASSCYTNTATPAAGTDLSTFTITLNPVTGATTKTCTAGTFPYGCTAGAW